MREARVGNGGLSKPAANRIDVAVLIEERSGVYYARCPILNVTTRAGSPEQAFRYMEEEIRFLLDVALRADSVVDLLDYRSSQRDDHPTWDDAVRLEVRTTDLELPVDIPDELLERFALQPHLAP